MKNWILAIRPKTILASIGPVILGLAISYSTVRQLNILVASLTLICAILLQFATNIANDYLDFKKGVDQLDRLGPVRVTSSGLISETKMKFALISLLTLSLFIGIYLMYIGGPFIIFIGLCSLYFSYGYTGGPFPLSYNGLGELSSLLFFGIFAVTGTTYLQIGYFSGLALILGISIGLISAAVLGINNLRDINTDKEYGKRTLAVRIGEKNQRYLIITCSIIPVIINLVLAFLLNSFILPFILIIFLIFSNNWNHILKHKIDSSLNNCLARTAQYLFLYSILTSIGIIYIK